MKIRLSLVILAVAIGLTAIGCAFPIHHQYNLPNAAQLMEPGPGVVFFMAVVVLTMLAVESFDPRLIWDAGTNWQGRHA